ncbi:hypothetical protein [Psychrilyobacter atlanticus]|uniref:hypothetical protein n=1 Tax=Psychrilyobacter atlanticus TaxID=271091 RepID=UPI0004904C48|nr:hypothetical protein [Psychrilyobacter atlanticus]
MKQCAYYIDCATEEVHKSGCPNMPTANKINLGKHTTAPKAVKAALSKGFTNANGCPLCCSLANKK